MFLYLVVYFYTQCRITPNRRDDQSSGYSEDGWSQGDNCHEGNGVDGCDELSEIGGDGLSEIGGDRLSDIGGDRLSDIGSDGLSDIGVGVRNDGDGLSDVGGGGLSDELSDDGLSDQLNDNYSDRDGRDTDEGSGFGDSGDESE